MSESYPQQPSETGLGLGDVSVAEAQRLLARLKQEQAQLVADQRQLKQQCQAQERLRAELDARQQELEQALQTFQRQRQAFLDQNDTTLRSLEAQRSELLARTTDLQHREEALRAREQQLLGEAQRLDARSKNIDAQQADLQAQQQALAARKASLDQLDADLQARASGLAELISRRELAACDITGTQEQLRQREQHLQAQAAELALAQQELAQREAALQDRGIALDAQQEDLRRQSEHLQTQKKDLQEQARQLARQQQSLGEQMRKIEAQHHSLVRQQEALNRLQMDLAAREASVRQKETQLADLEQRADEVALRQRDLLAQQEALQQNRQQVAALEAALADRQRCLEQLEADLQRRQHPYAAGQGDAHPPSSALAGQLLSVQKQLAERDAQLLAASQQVASLNKRLEGLQAELAVLREQKQRLPGQCDTLHQQYLSLEHHCQSLQAAVQGFPETQEAKRDDTAVWPLEQSPTDALSAIAIQVASTRRSGMPVAGQAGRSGSWAVAAAVAVFVGFLAAGGAFLLSPPRYRLSAQIVLPAGSPLAERPQLAEGKHRLAGRLLEADLLDASVAGNALTVTANPAERYLAVELLTASPARTSEDLKAVLEKYCKDLQGETLVAARTQLEADLARQVADCQRQLEQLAAKKADLQAQAKALEVQDKPYADAQVAAQQAYKQLEELLSRSEKPKATLRALLSMPPASRIEITPDRLMQESAKDPQLVAVRGQVAVRGAELREMLAQLVGKAADRCSQMDANLGTFIEFLASQHKQISDEALQAEVKGIAEPSDRLRQIVLDSRQQIEELSSAIGKAQDISQARSLVTLHGESEKALESLINQAAEAIRKIDELLEKIPAGGQDVTRRTVLQQRLRSAFAHVQNTHHEVTETLNGLRPAVNFRLDAALSSVEGLARQLDERQKALAEQLQQQEVRQLRQKYDKQVQDTQAELDNYNIQRDRLFADLAAAGDRMRQAEAVHGRLLEIRWQIANLEAQAADVAKTLADTQQRADKVKASVTQPVPIRLHGPVVQQPAVNTRNRLISAIAAGAMTFAVGLAVCMLVLQKQAVRRPFVRPLEYAAGSN